MVGPYIYYNKFNIISFFIKNTHANNYCAAPLTINNPHEQTDRQTEGQTGIERDRYSRPSQKRNGRQS